MAADTAVVSTPLQPARDGAKALLLTVLGEFVLPAGGAAWTSTLVAAGKELGVTEKNARQAIARTADQGLIEPERHGRTVRWLLTTHGRSLLEAGTERIYGFGRSLERWGGQWLITHCQVGESHRALRARLRAQVGFLGFGELSPSLFVSPHLDREAALRDVLDHLGLLDSSVVLRASAAAADIDLLAKAWDLDVLDESYQAFIETHSALASADGPGQFAALVGLVHDWRRFPTIDPELPPELLPSNWAGAEAAELFFERHAALSAGARRWFDERERANAPSTGS